MDLGKTLAESCTYSTLCFQESVAFPMLTTLDVVDPLAKGDGTLTASEVKDALDQVGWVRCNGHPRLSEGTEWQMRTIQKRQTSIGQN